MVRIWSELAFVEFVPGEREPGAGKPAGSIACS